MKTLGWEKQGNEKDTKTNHTLPIRLNAKLTDDEERDNSASRGRRMTALLVIRSRDC
jgi:hypothetical protein